MDAIEKKYSFKELLKSLSFKEKLKVFLIKLLFIISIILFSVLITYIINSFVYHGDSEKFLYDFKEFHLNLINKIIYGIPLTI